MRAEIQRLQRSLGVTTIYVTHDQTEAMTMRDRIAVMRDGALQQVDTPERVYQRPVNQFVAGFIGSPAMNMVDALLKRKSDGFSEVLVHFPVSPDGSTFVARLQAQTSAQEGQRLVLAVDPRRLHFFDPQAGGAL